MSKGIDQAPYYCEMCGRPVYRRKEYLVDGVVMILCSKCAKYGKPIERKKPTKKIQQQIKQRKKIERAVKEVFEEEWELVEDYHIRIKKAREKLGLTQERLSLKIGETVSYIRKLEQGKIKPTDTVIEKLEKVLNVKLRKPILPVSGSSEEKGGDRITLGDIVIVKKKKKK